MQELKLLIQPGPLMVWNWFYSYHEVLILTASDPCSTATQEPFLLQGRVNFHTCGDLERRRFFINGPEMQPPLDLEVA